MSLSRNHTVVVIIDSLTDCWVAVLALQALGLNTVCVRSSPVIEALGLNNVAGIVTTEREAPKLQLEPDARTGNRVVAIPNPWYGCDELPVDPAFKGNTEIGGHILYTSGTTGSYKKLFFSADLIQRCSAERSEPGNYNADVIFHCANFGLWTGAGYKTPLSVWYARGYVIFDQRPDWYKYFLHSGMTNAVLIPDMVNQLLNALDELPELSSPMDFTLLVSAGFISRKLAEQLVNRVTQNLVNGYGSSEVNVTVLGSVVTSLDDLHWLSSTDRRTVEIIDESGNPSPIDVEGQLRIRLLESDCTSYLDDPQATAKVFRDGYFYPGDMAERRADGRIRILGRSADVINFRGQKLSVAPIEYKIQNILGVNAVCLFSGISKAGEEEVVIAIESDHWPEKSDLNNLGHEFAQFDQVRFAIIFPFPRTRTGTSKIDRVALRKLIFAVH
jgi:acyl-coenzyme A synthetase/AMP-(fatty) acid ligase